MYRIGSFIEFSHYKTFNNQNVNNQILFHNILTVSQYFNEELTIFSRKEEEWPEEDSKGAQAQLLRFKLSLNFINSILQSTEFTHLCTNLQFTFRISENGKGFVMFMTRVKKQEIQKKHFKSGNREEKKNFDKRNWQLRYKLLLKQSSCVLDSRTSHVTKEKKKNFFLCRS